MKELIVMFKEEFVVVFLLERTSVMRGKMELFIYKFTGNSQCGVSEEPGIG